MNVSIQAIGGAIAVVAWWWFSIVYPEIHVSNEVVAASVVLWQIPVGIFALLLNRIFGKDVHIDGHDDDETP